MRELRCAGPATNTLVADPASAGERTSTPNWTEASPFTPMIRMDEKTIDLADISACSSTRW